MNHFRQQRCCPARDLALCMDLWWRCWFESFQQLQNLVFTFFLKHLRKSQQNQGLIEPKESSPESLTPRTFKLSINSLRSKQSSCNVHYPRFLLQFPEGTWNWSKNLTVKNIALTEENYFPRTKCRVYSNKIKTSHHILISNWITFQLLFLTCSWWKKKSGCIHSSFLSYYWNLDILQFSL